MRETRQGRESACAREANHVAHLGLHCTTDRRWNVHTHTHTHAQVQTHTHTHAHTSTYTGTRTHTHSHKHTHTHTHHLRLRVCAGLQILQVFFSEIFGFFTGDVRGWSQTNFVGLWSVSRPRLAEMAIEIWVMCQLTENSFETSSVR